MKRDMDLVRDLLLHIEGLLGRPGTNYLLEGWNDDMRLPGWEPEMVNHHLKMLADGGLIELCRSQPAGTGVMTMGLSWDGRDFLDTVRDPEVWKRTKEGASKMGGWTFGLLKDLGTAYLKHVAKERLGLDL
ncbi:hypothetical protein GOFOIKOB_5722 [Methylobacterium tardum]|uniref:DUF2513 domain-containing protein n=1 Tax=Methylobacterium tardum TaxID=374432 RepID=A0AA37TLH6_9HYPH|nr:DUF2513 domain-containing protein [Methylobacterium tardum]GJE52648.1 hypothetical protein GOFOIKOB_5722 [Methylobacterium tardum]GLS73508.1 hypothetical protein GCM10007890_55230 [Methylobacterium tardum]